MFSRFIFPSAQYRPEVVTFKKIYTPDQTLISNYIFTQNHCPRTAWSPTWTNPSECRPRVPIYCLGPVSSWQRPVSCCGTCRYSSPGSSSPSPYGPVCTGASQPGHPVQSYAPPSELVLLYISLLVS